MTDRSSRTVAAPAAIFAALDTHGVDYLVIGGLAVIAHGYPRTTQDVDILPNPDQRNLERLAAALSDLEAQALSEGGARIPLDLSKPEALAFGSLLLETRYGALDLVNGDAPDLIRYRHLAAGATDVRLAGTTIHVLSKDDLIAMKREAGRPKDLRDIAALTEVERGGP